MIDVAQCPPCCSVADSRAGCPYVFAAAEVSQERENGVAERERKGDMTQGHMESSGGSGVTWHMACFSVRQLLFSLVQCRVCFASQHRDALVFFADECERRSNDQQKKQID